MCNPISASHAATAKSITNHNQKCHSRALLIIPISICQRSRIFVTFIFGQLPQMCSTDVFFFSQENQRTIRHQTRTLLSMYSFLFNSYQREKMIRNLRPPCFICLNNKQCTVCTPDPIY